MKPSPEIVQLPRRPHFQPWGDMVAWPLLFAFLGIPLLVPGVVGAVRSGFTSISAVWLLMFGLPLSAAFVITLVNAVRRRRQSTRDLRALEARADQYISSLADPLSRALALQRLAQLAFLCASRRDGWFDATLWDTATAAQSPRAIVMTPGLDLSEPVETVAEEFDLGADPAAPWRSLLAEAVFWTFLLAFATVTALNRPTDSVVTAGIIGATAVIAALHLCRRAGVRPIAISSAIVTPGRVELGGLLGAVTFTVNDSILFVGERREGATERVLQISLQRRDNVRRTIRLTGPDDPRLSETLARWTAGAALATNPDEEA